MFQHTHTTDISFLNQTQQVIENMNVFKLDTISHCSKSINTNWKHIKHDPKFMETYGYLEWDLLKEYNTNSIVLQ